MISCKVLFSHKAWSLYTKHKLQHLEREKLDFLSSTVSVVLRKDFDTVVLANDRLRKNFYTIVPVNDILRNFFLRSEKKSLRSISFTGTIV